MLQLPNKGKILALDLGTRRTGVAISDENQIIAFMRDEIEHESTEQLLAELAKIVKEDDVVGILAGLPLDMQGEETEQTELVRAAISAIKTAIKLPVQTIDERLTTKQGGSDSDAARIMLETMLSSD